MNKIFSDRQLDRMMKKIVRDSTPDEELLNDIAASPQLWQKVQSRIAREKTSRAKGWIPTWIDWRILAFASAGLMVCLGLFLFSDLEKKDFAAEQIPPEKTVAEIARAIDEPKAVVPQDAEPEQISTNSNSSKLGSSERILAKPKTKVILSNKLREKKSELKKLPGSAEKSEEIKTDFIALAFSPIPESGQILKVKVPRSMMVSLGVTNKVENSSELVDAEVLLGDDGSAHAIRFTK